MKQIKRLLPVAALVSVLLAVLAMTAVAENAPTSGQCGDHLYWALDKDSGALTISGEGAMWDYKEIVYWNEYGCSSAPWAQSYQSIKTVIISEGVTSIGVSAFRGCLSLESISIPDSMLRIEHYAFYYCIALKNLTIPDSVTKIASYAFLWCEALEWVTLGRGITEIELETFCGCENLSSIEIPDSVTTIGQGAFAICEALRSINIPESVTEIGRNAFERSGLENVYISKNVTSIGAYAFERCSSLVSIIVDANNEYYMSDSFGCLYDIEKAALVQYPIGNDRLSFTLPDWVTSIASDSFMGCTAIKTICLSDNVTFIGMDAFADCVSLEELYLGKSVTSLFPGCFYNCISLKKITLPLSVTDIYTGYDNWGEIEDIYYEGSEAEWSAVNILDGVGDRTSINASIHFLGTEDTLFSGRCGANVLWRFDAANNHLSFTGSGAMYSSENLSEGIPWYSFIETIESVSMQDGITTIVPGAFAGCTSLKSVKIPDSIVDLGDGTFVGCSALKSIDLPSGVESIPMELFENSGIESITIPTAVKEIDMVAFYGCKELSTVIFNENLETIGYSAFAECTSLQNLVFPNKLRIIGEFSFAPCESFTEIHIPNRVEAVGYAAFGACDNLQKIYFENRNTEIAENAIPITTTIYGYSGSTAEAYALENGNVFVSLDVLEINDEVTNIKVQFDTWTEGDADIHLVVKAVDTDTIAIPGAYTYENVHAYDISLIDENGTEVQPQTRVRVMIPLPEGFNPNAIAVYHKHTQDPEDVELIQEVRVEEVYGMQYVVFYTDAFSTFILVDTSSKIQPEPQPDPNMCPWCGKVHEGFFQKIIGFFHTIFAKLFGAKY